LSPATGGNGWRSAAEAKTAKKGLYVLRTTLTGAHLLRSGELRADLNENLDECGFRDASELIEQKRAGERIQLDDASARHRQRRVACAFELLDDAHASSTLPEEVPNAEALESWLIDLRTRDTASV